MPKSFWVLLLTLFVYVQSEVSPVLSPCNDYYKNEGYYWKEFYRLNSDMKVARDLFLSHSVIDNFDTKLTLESLEARTTEQNRLMKDLEESEYLFMKQVRFIRFCSFS